MIRSIIILLLLSYCAQAQYTPPMTNYTPKKYKAQYQNWDIDQGLEGQIFIANSEGVLCYDGAEWIKKTLPNGQIARTILVVDSRVYVGAYGEFGYFQKDSLGTYHYTSLMYKATNKLAKREEIWNIIKVKNAIWFQSFSTMYKFENNTIESTQAEGNFMFLHQIKDRILVQMIEGGIYEIPKFGMLRLLHNTEILSDKRVSSIVEGPDHGQYIIITEKNGVYLYANNQLVIWNDTDLLLKGQLNKGLRLKSGEYAIGCIQNGVFILDIKGRIIQHFNFNNGLQNNTILSLLEDKEGDLWVGTDKGIDWIGLSSKVSFYKDRTGNEGTVYDIFVSKNQTYMGTNKGLFFKNKDSTLFKIVEGTQGQVWDLCYYDNTLFCGHNEGTFMVENGSANKISNQNGGWYLLPHPQDKTVLLQATYTGIAVFRKINSKWIYTNRIKGFDYAVNKILFDSDGFLWATEANRGLFQLKLDDQYQEVDSVIEFGNQEGLADNYQVKMEKIGDKLIYFSDNKPKQFNKDTQKFNDWNTIHESKGRCIYFDEEQQVYVQNNSLELWNEQGVDKYQLPLVPNYENIIRSDNKYYVCLEDGLAIIIDDMKDHQDTLLHIPQIKQVQISGKKGIQRASLENHTTIDYSHNSVKFYYTLPVYNRPVQFKYMLEGYDDHWSNWTSDMTSVFIHLDPGSYTFNLLSDQSNIVTSYAFKISSPWHKGISGFLVFLGCLLLFSLMFFWLFNQQLSRERHKMEIEKRRQIKEESIRLRTSLLEEEVLNKSKELANTSVMLARKNETLLEIKQKLKLAKSNIDNDKPHGLHKLIHRVNRSISTGEEWQIFETTFNEIHEAFFDKIKSKHPKLTKADLNLAAFMKMDLSSKEIAPLLHISIRGVENKRYRLKKKLGIDKGVLLVDYLKTY